MMPGCSAEQSRTPVVTPAVRVSPRYYEIGIATAARAADAVRILKEAAQWLIERRIGHWSVDEFRMEDFAAAADAEELVIGLEDGAAAAVMLLQITDALYWPTESPGAALYIHKLAVRRAAAGQRWSARMIAWAATEARARAIPRLRLDTVPGPALRDLYETYGFVVVDPGPIKVGAVTVIRMERML